MEPDIDALKHEIAHIAALDEPIRRDLYLYVARSAEPVSRDEAAAGVGIGRALAAFHLDKLLEEGLLSAQYRRLSGRTGPGAGRPSKLYTRAPHDLHISLPPRQYELAARLFARTIAGAPSPELLAHLHESAHDFGLGLGMRAADAAGGRSEDGAQAALTAGGYEPFQDEDGTVRLRNCPFHTLAEEHRSLVCGMNLSLLEGVIAGLGARQMQAVLDPRPGLCCVALCRRQP